MRLRRRKRNKHKVIFVEKDDLADASKMEKLQQQTEDKLRQAEFLAGQAVSHLDNGGDLDDPVIAKAQIEIRAAAASVKELIQAMS